MTGLERTIFPSGGRLGGRLPSAKSDFGALMRKARQAASRPSAAFATLRGSLRSHRRAPRTCRAKAKTASSGRVGPSRPVAVRYASDHALSMRVSLCAQAFSSSHGSSYRLDAFALLLPCESEASARHHVGLRTIDSRKGLTHWRMQVADAICQSLRFVKPIISKT